VVGGLLKGTQTSTQDLDMNRTPFSSLFALPILLTAMALPVMAQAADKSAPNIVVIMGDDIGWSISVSTTRA
jgi:hypothetical protein